MKKYDIGLIGLGVMGRNFILNLAENGFSVLGYDLDREKVDALCKEGEMHKVGAVNSLKEFVSGLSTPKKIMMLVPADIVDRVVNDLLPLLEKDDLIMDAGNSYPDDTERRMREIEKKGYKYLGVGISGGAEGARRGPSMMPGGEKKSYELVKDIFESVAAKVNGEPCVKWMGRGSAGHFVKMVHNGIEYAIMQLISEAYDMMRNGLKMENSEMQSVFQSWNQGPLASYLIEITGDILGKKDEVEGGYLIDNILDRAKQNGTGKWTSQIALDLGVPVPTIDAAVSMRHISAFKEEREKADLILNGPEPQFTNEKAIVLKKLKNALYMSMMLTYVQGFEFLLISSYKRNFDTQLSDVASIWRGGCIIRSAMLDDIKRTFSNSPALPNLLFDNHFSSLANLQQADLRYIVMQATESGIPSAAFMSVLSYFDAYRSGHLAANMIQAQRDYFGSHTYQKIGDPGEFHTDWS